MSRSASSASTATFRFDAKVYYTRYDNFIFQQPTGIFCGEEFATCGIETELLQTFIAQRDAIFRGAEVAWQWDVAPLGTGIFGVDGQYDTVRATFTDGSNVPRIPPQRVGGGAYWRNDNWFVRMGLLHAFAQNDLGAVRDADRRLQSAQGSRSIHRKFWQYSPWGPVEVTTGIVGNNLLDADIRNPVQFHKDEILLPGRSVKFFLNAKFGADRPSGPPGYYKAAQQGATTRPCFYKAPIATAWSWAGFYLGANAGYGAEQVDHRLGLSDAATGDPLFGGPISANGATAAIFGVQAGYNWVGGHLARRHRRRPAVFAPARKPDIRLPRRRLQSGLAPLDAPVAAIFDQKLEWFGTLRGRLGTTITPDALAYVTGGVAVGDIKSAGTIAGFDAVGNPRQHRLQPSAHEGRLDDRRRPRGATGRQLDRQDRVPLHGLRLDRDVRRPSRRMLPSRRPSIPGSRTTSCASASTTSSTGAPRSWRSTDHDGGVIADHAAASPAGLASNGPKRANLP